MFERGLVFIDISVIYSKFKFVYFNAASIEFNGKPAQCLTLFILSSSIAYNKSPSLIKQAMNLHGYNSIQVLSSLFKSYV